MKPGQKIARSPVVLVHHEKVCNSLIAIIWPSSIVASEKRLKPLVLEFPAGIQATTVEDTLGS